MLDAEETIFEEGFSLLFADFAGVEDEGRLEAEAVAGRCFLTPDSFVTPAGWVAVGDDGMLAEALDAATAVVRF